MLFNYPEFGDHLVIGKFCQIASGTKFIMDPANHRISSATTYPFNVFGGAWTENTPPHMAQLPRKGDTIIGSDVWIGRESIIMPGTKIGDGAIIAAYSGNEMLNSVLSIYHSRFTDRGLSLICNVSTGKELPCSDLSLCTILSNALENSMHALEQLESPSKWARLTLSQKKNHILFQLENPVEKIPAFVDGVPVSTRNGHGIGVRSIIYYVEQLHGQCHFSIVDHCFVLRIII